MNEDREPSITTVRNGVTHTETQYAVWMQFDGDPNVTNFHVEAATNTGAGWSAPTKLQGPRENAGDAMLSPNNYVAGLNPQTVYAVSTSYNHLSAGRGFGDNGLLVWKNSGSGWSYDQVEQHTGVIGGIDDRWLDDKPSIAVSQQPNTAGTVYVAYLRNGINGNNAQSMGFAMLDDVTPPVGQWKIRSNIPIPASNGVQSPIVVSDPIYAGSPGGNVYVTYLDWNNHVIYLYRSSDKGATWVSEGQVDLLHSGSIRLAGTAMDPKLCANRALGVCVEAVSMISARWNWHSTSDTFYGSIGIVLNAWDGPDINTAKMHSYFFRWNPQPPCGFA